MFYVKQSLLWLVWSSVFMAVNFVWAQGFSSPFPNAPAANSVTLNPALKQVLDQTGLVGNNTTASPAFTWTIETTRPFKQARVVEETFRPTATHGINQYTYWVVSPKPDDKVLEELKKPQPKVFSVRGLERFQETDQKLSFSIGTLALPPPLGKKFDLLVVFEKREMNQKCEVMSVRDAAAWNPSIKGQASVITCEGKGQYLGGTVTIISTILYFHSLGMFLNEREDIKSPIGSFSLVKKITQFRLL